MDEIDFVMTYPCFILLDGPNVPATSNAEGDDALLLFTDEDLLSQFMQTWPTGRQVGRAVIEHSDALKEILGRFNSPQGMSEKPLSHVAIDPTPRQKVRCYPISSFLAHLDRGESQEHSG